MNKIISAIGVFALSSQLGFAQIKEAELNKGALRGSIWVGSAFNPSLEQFDAFLADCANAEKSIEEKMRTIAANNGASFDQLVVKKLIDYNWDNGGAIYSCDVHFLGKTSAKVLLESLYKAKNHLKKKGYKKPFTEACSDIEQELSANANEIFQSTGIGWTLFQGNRCAVRSIVMTVKQ